MTCRVSVCVSANTKVEIQPAGPVRFSLTVSFFQSTFGNVNSHFLKGHSRRLGPPDSSTLNQSVSTQRSPVVSRVSRFFFFFWVSSSHLSSSRLSGCWVQPSSLGESANCGQWGTHQVSFTTFYTYSFVDIFFSSFHLPASKTIQYSHTGFVFWNLAL